MNVGCITTTHGLEKRFEFHRLYLYLSVFISCVELGHGTSVEFERAGTGELKMGITGAAWLRRTSDGAIIDIVDGDLLRYPIWNVVECGICIIMTLIWGR